MRLCRQVRSGQFKFLLFRNMLWYTNTSMTDSNLPYHHYAEFQYAAEEEHYSTAEPRNDVEVSYDIA